MKVSLRQVAGVFLLVGVVNAMFPDSALWSRLVLYSVVFVLHRLEAL